MQAPGQVQPGSGEGSEGSREGLGGFGAEPGHLQQGSGVPEKVWEALVQSQGSPEGSEEGVGGFGAKPNQVQLLQMVPGGSSSTGFRRRFREALVQSQVRFNRVPDKVPEKRRFRRRFREALAQSQVRLKPNTVPENVPEKVWEALCSARSGSVGFAAI